jgi:hypothetical protein
MDGFGMNGRVLKVSEYDGHGGSPNKPDSQIPFYSSEMGPQVKSINRIPAMERKPKKERQGTFNMS